MVCSLHFLICKSSVYVTLWVKKLEVEDSPGFLQRQVQQLLDCSDLALGKLGLTVQLAVKRSLAETTYVADILYSDISLKHLGLEQRLVHSYISF